MVFNDEDELVVAGVEEDLHTRAHKDLGVVTAPPYLKEDQDIRLQHLTMVSHKTQAKSKHQ